MKDLVAKVTAFKEEVTRSVPIPLPRLGGIGFEDIVELSTLLERLNRDFTLRCDPAVSFQIHLILGEVAEVLFAMATGRKEELLKELCDLIYVVVGAGIKFQMPLVEGMERVHASNMTKEFEAGFDPKRFKGAKYQPAKVGDLFDE